MKQILLILVLILITTGCETEEIISGSEEQIKKHEESITFDDYKLIDEQRQFSLMRYKYKGPGTVIQAERIFTKYLNDQDWRFKEKKEDQWFNTLIFEKTNSKDDLELIIGEDYPFGTTIIIEIPNH